MDILKYKDYEGTAELDMSRRVCRGKVLFIDDLVTYEASSPAELQKEFEAAVDDYLVTCCDLSREPQKPLKGQFNVRIPPALHKAVTLRAIGDNVSLNDVVVRALDVFVNEQVGINHNVRVTVEIPEQSTDTLISSSSLAATQLLKRVANASH
ncbi:MAG: type II toxin-antitoxin system HicB family antitoxin [Nitrosomonas sp.]|nr:type II toxin-antitoxin system HicB family antitoxin [Nitrosomonas sp.]MBP7113305.1 type II toxin-antitoxin system HicB family antitoxin [Nitrosomonas sp.]